MSARITDDYILNYDIKYDMDWALIRKISKAVENEIRVYTNYDWDGTMMVTTYSAGKRQSQKPLGESDIEYWRAINYIFGNLDWERGLTESLNLRLTSPYKYNYMVSAEIVDWENHTSTNCGRYIMIEKLPKFVAEMTEKYKTNLVLVEE